MPVTRSIFTADSSHIRAWYWARSPARSKELDYPPCIVTANDESTGRSHPQRLMQEDRWFSCFAWTSGYCRSGETHKSSWADPYTCPANLQGKLRHRPHCLDRKEIFGTGDWALRTTVHVKMFSIFLSNHTQHKNAQRCLPGWKSSSISSSNAQNCSRACAW